MFSPPVLILAAALLSALGCAVLLGFAARLPHDQPNARSLHGHPVPRVGGLAVWLGFAPVALLASAMPAGAPVWAAWAALVAVSLIDDARRLPPALRLAVHGFAGLVAAQALLPGDPAWRVLALALLIAWSANLFNFMDGSDGLAASMGIVGFAACAFAAPSWAAALPAALALAATVPFAVVNRPPARMFLGDCGAVPLGFLAAVIGADGVIAGTWPGWFPCLAFLPFIADSGVTLLRRGLRGERVWEAHHEHYYQRMHRLGAGHRGTLLRYGALMLGCGASAVLALRLAPAAGWIVLAAWCAVLAIVFGGIDYHWRRHRSSSA